MVDREPITRKKFVSAILKGLVGITALGTITEFSRKCLFSTKESHIKIKPVAGEHYGQSFLNLCKNAKFETVEQAIRAVKDRHVSYQLIYEKDTMT